MNRDLKQRSVAEQPRVHASGDGGGDDQRDERPNRVLEQQQFDRQDDRGQRCAERGRHARRGACRKQNLSF